MFSFVKQFFSYSTATRKLREATSLVSESLKQAGYPERVQYVYDSIDCNESGLALEILCENLYDFSCPVPQKAYDLLEESGMLMKIDSKHWKRLKSLIVK